MSHTVKLVEADDRYIANSHEPGIWQIYDLADQKWLEPRSDQVTAERRLDELNGGGR